MYFDRVPRNNAERDRGQSCRPRRRLTDVILATTEHSPIMLAMGNPLRDSSLEDSNSEHSSAPSSTSSPCQELLAEPEQLCQAQHRYQYSNSISLSYGPHCSYKDTLTQISPRLHRGCIDEGRGHDINLSRMYIKHQLSSCTNGHYEDYYKEAPLYQQRGRLISSHMKLSRVPSLKEYPQHPSRALPPQVVSGELISWHQRCQLQPRSLNRQGTVCIWNLPLRESPLSHQHDFYDQVKSHCYLWYDLIERSSKISVSL